LGASLWQITNELKEKSTESGSNVGGRKGQSRGVPIIIKGKFVTPRGSIMI